MKLVKALSALIALAGAAILALAFTRSVYGQPRPDGLWIPDRQWTQEAMDTRYGHKIWTQELTLLRGRSSQLGAPGRDLETAEAERLNVGGAVMSEAVRALNARTARILFHFNFDFDLQDTARRVRLGITAQELTPDVGAYFGAKVGVLVASMVADSPAARAGLRASDVITSVDGRSVTSGNDLVRELREVSGDGGVTLGIVRDKKESSRTAKIDVEPDRRARPARPIRSTPVA